MSEFVLPLEESELVESKMILTIKLKPWSKYHIMPWQELHGKIVTVDSIGAFKVTGIDDTLAPGEDAYTRTIVVQQL